MRRASTTTLRHLRTRQPRRYASHAAEASSEQFPVEKFSSVMWPISAALGIAGYFAYRLSIQHALEPTNPLRKTEEGFPAEAEDHSKPWLTRYLAYHLPDKKLAAEKHEANLKQVLQYAEDRIITQQAELPRMRRKRYVQGFEQASPHSIAVGSQTDMSDLKIDYSIKPNLPPEESEHH